MSYYQNPPAIIQPAPNQPPEQEDFFANPKDTFLNESFQNCSLTTANGNLDFCLENKSLLSQATELEV
jgi:uncharacterized protein (DUF2164 family)